jgi:hypothetical protein
MSKDMETLNFKAASARWQKILARVLNILVEVCFYKVSSKSGIHLPVMSLVSLIQMKILYSNIE